MVKPCIDCEHSEFKQGIAGLWCTKKSKLCSLARRTNEGNDDQEKDCFAEAAAQREVAVMTPAVTA